MTTNQQSKFVQIFDEESGEALAADPRPIFRYLTHNYVLFAPFKGLGIVRNYRITHVIEQMGLVYVKEIDTPEEADAWDDFSFHGNKRKVTVEERYRNISRWYSNYVDAHLTVTVRIAAFAVGIVCFVCYWLLLKSYLDVYTGLALALIGEALFFSIHVLLSVSFRN